LNRIENIIKQPAPAKLALYYKCISISAFIIPQIKYYNVLYNKASQTSKKTRGSQEPVIAHLDQSCFNNNSTALWRHLGGRVQLLDTILEEDHPMTIPSKFGSNCATGSRQDGFYVNFP
jgi:hypothetical protein